MDRGKDTGLTVFGEISLMSHDLGRLRLGRLLGFVNVHGVIIVGRSLALAFRCALFLLEFVFALVLEVDTALIRELGFFLAVLDAGHLRVLFGCRFTVRLGSSLGSLFYCVLLSFVCAVFLLVGDQVGLGLLGRELGRCRGLGIPALISLIIAMF